MSSESSTLLSCCGVPRLTEGLKELLINSSPGVTLASKGKLCISNFQSLAVLSLQDSLQCSTKEGIRCRHHQNSAQRTRTFGRTYESTVIGHGLMLLLSIAKWHDLLNSQSPVYVGDRQAPLDLLNLLPEGTDLDPDIWLMRQKSILAFPRRNTSRRSFGSKRYF